MRLREHELVTIAFREFRQIKGVHILADNIVNRLGVFSFYIDNVHFNLAVKLLNDRYGIQVRGGCACAGTYGHFLLDVSHASSNHITYLINQGDLSQKPGWIRASLHPTMTNDELNALIKGVREIIKYHKEWEKDYIYNNHTNEFRHKDEPIDKTVLVKPWFVMD